MTTMLKRDRLIEAAKDLFDYQGIVCTTWANIAQQTQVPLTNRREPHLATVLFSIIDMECSEAGEIDKQRSAYALTQR